MNYRAMKIHSDSHFQGGVQVKNKKKEQSLNFLKTENKPEKQKKAFYTDLPSVTISEKLQKDKIWESELKNFSVKISVT